MNPLSAFPLCKVLVLGDVMLDEYVHGRVRRISPEAPVPVLDLDGRRWHPGGAANVAVNLAALGAEVMLAGILGPDPSGNRLRASLAGRGVSTDHLLTLDHCRTTTKTRVVCGAHQIVRIDDEQPLSLSCAQQALLAKHIVDAARHASACVISDYGKGVATPALCRVVVAAAAARGIPVVVDPKGTDFTRYRGATLVTPNLPEALAAAGCANAPRASLDSVARTLFQACPAALLITRGADGMSLFDRGAPPLHLPAQARHVYDVTGAGDTVVATVALGLAAGLPLPFACRLGNLAAGIVVGEPGAAAISLAQLQAALQSASLAPGQLFLHEPDLIAR